MNQLVTLADTEIETISNLAACNYTPEKVCAYLGYNFVDFMREFNMPSSDIRQAYDAGVFKAQYSIMNKQRELAESGNITSAQIFLKEAEKIHIDNIRNKCLFGDDH